MTDKAQKDTHPPSFYFGWYSPSSFHFYFIFFFNLSGCASKHTVQNPWS